MALSRRASTWDSEKANAVTAARSPCPSKVRRDVTSRGAAQPAKVNAQASRTRAKTRWAAERRHWEQLLFSGGRCVLPFTCRLERQDSRGTVSDPITPISSRYSSKVSTLRTLDPPVWLECPSSPHSHVKVPALPWR